MSLKITAPQAALPESDTASVPDKNSIEAKAKKISALCRLLTEGGSKPTREQYLILLTMADGCGLLSESEYRVFSDMAPTDDIKFGLMSNELREHLLAKLVNTAGVDRVRDGVSALAVTVLDK
jgi:hypothetical protein